jgi:ornithine cyclodeaminase/alanine dehydrogenase-like protein (mu-crystallin family)
MSESNKSAAEIRKGDTPVLCLSESEVAALLDPVELIAELEQGFIALSRGAVQSPDRPEITVPGKGFSLAMPAWTPGMNIAVKIVNVYEGNLDLGLPNHLATITLYDPDTGQLICVMDGTHVTAIRTAAAAIVSVKALARTDAKIATIIGAGVQGREHLKLLPLVRDFDEIRIASLLFEDAEKLASLHARAKAVSNIEEAVRSSDVVCLSSHAYKPVIQADWVSNGTHVSSVGYAPPAGELPVELAREHPLFVETLDAFENPPVGCAELATIDSTTGTPLGDVLSGTRPGRTSDEQITVYKAMGIAMEDMVAANIAYRKAAQEKAGKNIVL